MMMLFRDAATILGHAQFATRAEECSRMHMAIEARRWTLEEMHALPEDGNKYELIHGELFVTPAPTNDHETIASRLARLLDRYVESQGLGLVYRPRAVFRVGRDVEVEPDLMVRALHPDPKGSWETAPLPKLVVEVLSPSTRKHDRVAKRKVYIDEARISEYWIVDGDARTLTSCATGRADLVLADRVTWHPSGAADPLAFDLGDIFDQADQ
jgi:Uma2 family endonuclease